MRTIVPFLLVAFLLVGAGIANAQDNEAGDSRGSGGDASRGRQNVSSYIIFFAFTLLTVYFVFRGNKRA